MLKIHVCQKFHLLHVSQPWAESIGCKTALGLSRHSIFRCTLKSKCDYTVLVSERKPMHIVPVSIAEGFSWARSPTLSLCVNQVTKKKEEIDKWEGSKNTNKVWKLINFPAEYCPLQSSVFQLAIILACLFLPSANEKAITYEHPCTFQRLLIYVFNWSRVMEAHIHSRGSK